MHETITAFVGLDAHAQSTAIGVAEAGRAAARFIGTVGPKFAELSKALAKLGDPAQLLIVYEAGPCGFALVRELRAAGYRCEVVAPSKIPRRPGDRVKTDRRDALTLASLSRAGELRFVVVPDERDEAIRDLSRTRIDAVRARLKARQQLKALLLRHGRRYTGKTSWTAAHERYLATLSFGHRAQDIAFVEYRQTVSEAQARVERLGAALTQERPGITASLRASLGHCKSARNSSPRWCGRSPGARSYGLIIATGNSPPEDYSTTRSVWRSLGSLRPLFGVSAST